MAAKAPDVWIHCGNMKSGVYGLKHLSSIGFRPKATLQVTWTFSPLDTHPIISLELCYVVTCRAFLSHCLLLSFYFSILHPLLVRTLFLFLFLFLSHLLYLTLNHDQILKCTQTVAPNSLQTYMNLLGPLGNYVLGVGQWHPAMSYKDLFFGVRSTLPCLALPCLALPCLALPCLALPCLALPCLALPCLELHCTALSVFS